MHRPHLKSSPTPGILERGRLQGASPVGSKSLRTWMVTEGLISDWQMSRLPSNWRADNLARIECSVPISIYCSFSSIALAKATNTPTYTYMYVLHNLHNRIVANLQVMWQPLSIYMYNSRDTVMCLCMSMDMFVIWSHAEYLLPKKSTCDLLVISCCIVYIYRCGHSIYMYLTSLGNRVYGRFDDEHARKHHDSVSFM